jgi:hypothetical protein
MRANEQGSGRSAVTAIASTIERQTIAKISWRLLPLVALALFPRRLGAWCRRHHLLFDRSIGTKGAAHARRRAGVAMSAGR